MKRIIFIICGILLLCELPAQPLQRKALFLGNSYTYVNNLPGLVAALAHYAGDSLFFDSYTPGGYTLGWQPTAHVTDSVSLARIRDNVWDFVVLQEQSQTPAIARLRDSCMIPASIVLNDSIKSSGTCTRTLFYLTWGRRFGGIQCFTPAYCSPAFADFDQMQDSLTRAYKITADSVDSWIAPVGEAWRLVLHNTGMVLHDADDSHPNLNGSYLAACVFYGAIFGKPSLGNTFTAGLDPDSAAILQLAADSITFGYSEFWNLWNDIPEVSFVPAISSDTLFTQNNSSGALNWHWDFGDGDTSNLFEPVHVYASTGTYTVRLSGCNNCFCDSMIRSVTVVTTAIPKQRSGPLKIRLLPPDETGLSKFDGYSGDGNLRFYSMTGELTAILPVHSGMVYAGKQSHQLRLWILSAPDGQMIATGKDIIW